MSDLKPVTMYCCKGCQHLYYETVTACDCGTGCDPFEYEIWEARRTQPEAAPAQDLSAAKKEWRGSLAQVICDVPLPEGSDTYQHGFVTAKKTILEALRKAGFDALSAGDRVDAVEGDLLPPVGSKVLIHLARQDEWVEHTVTGYYAWADLSGRYDVHRVFVRVVDAAGYANARLLKDVRLQSQKAK